MEELLKNVAFSSLTWQIIAPLIFMGVDILTGYVQAVINKNPDSKIMRQGLLHKSLLLIVIMIGYVVDYAFGLNCIAKVIAMYICVMELTSILENLKRAGLDLKGLNKFLNNMKEEK